MKPSRNKTVFMDCPYTGKGDEFSPINLVEAALGGCILLAMGAVAMRHDIDLSDARIDTSISTTDMPVMRFQSIDVQVAMPRGLSNSHRSMLERAQFSEAEFREVVGSIASIQVEARKQPT